MKLSKKNKARQRAIAKALASGKALGGLIAGFTVAAIAGCCNNETPHVLMGAVRSQQQPNATRENTKGFQVDGYFMPEPQQRRQPN